MDNFIELTLYDPETDETFTIKVSPSDAAKAHKNMAFATTLLNVARQKYTSVRVLPTDSSNTSIMEEQTSDVEMDNTSDNMDGYSNDDPLSGENFRWCKEAVLLLVDKFRYYEKDMSSGKITHKKAWDKISEALNEKGYIVTGKQCSTRFNTMKRTYKTVKDHNSKSGNNKRTWPYYEIMDGLLRSKPFMSPLSTLSSTGNEATCTEAETSNACGSSSSNASSCSADFVNVSRKRKKGDIASALKENRAITEEAKERRHREKMEIKIKLIEKLDKILDKIDL